MGQTIYLYGEGETEKAFVGVLQEFLKPNLMESKTKIRGISWKGPVPRKNKLSKMVKLHLMEPGASVIALTDVYPDFENAVDAKSKLLEWSDGNHGGRFHAHAALHDFEAWLLPYWSRALAQSRQKQQAPGKNPEAVNHHSPPSKHFERLFEMRGSPRSYNKRIHSAKILEGQDLSIAIEACPELKKLINTILKICGVPELP